VQNSIGASRRSAFRTVIAQATVTLALAGLLGAMFGTREAWAALAGAGAVTLGSALMAWRAFGGGVNGAGGALMRLLGGMALKWLVVLGALYWALSQARLPPVALLAGLCAALAVPLFSINLKSRVQP